MLRYPLSHLEREVYTPSEPLFGCSCENGVLTAAEHIQSSLPLEALRCDGCKTRPARVWACHKLHKLCPLCVKVNTCRTILWSPFCLCNLSLCPHHVRVSNIFCVRFFNPTSFFCFYCIPARLVNDAFQLAGAFRTWFLMNPGTTCWA